MNAALLRKAGQLPLTSGVYLMKGAAGEILYIGKAVSLRRRVQSYFRGKPQNIKTDLLVENIRDIDFILTQSEAEALILEASLVKKHQPKYNIDLKDGKSYPYIRITGGAFPLIDVIRLARPDAREPESDYFGPYTDAALVREALQIIRRVFPFRTCAVLPAKACLYKDIGLCCAPCVALISQAEYDKLIMCVRLILNGDQDQLYRQLRGDMETHAAAGQYEQAAGARDRMRAVGALYSSSPDVNYFKEAEQLERALGLDRRPERIECIDISTTMGERAVGSLVSFLDGKPDKANYRRFRIKDVQGMDDFKMVAEVVRRRYGRLKREGAVFPDLVMIDGGKGQLSAAAAVLKELGIIIPLISLAKKEEEVFMPGRRVSIKLSRDSLVLKLLQRLRDEAHRFALAYHRLLRGKKMLGL